MIYTSLEVLCGEPSDKEWCEAFKRMLPDGTPSVAMFSLLPYIERIGVEGFAWALPRCKFEAEAERVVGEYTGKCVWRAIRKFNVNDENLVRAHNVALLQFRGEKVPRNMVEESLSDLDSMNDLLLGSKGFSEVRIDERAFAHWTMSAVWWMLCPDTLWARTKNALWCASEAMARATCLEGSDDLDKAYSNERAEQTRILINHFEGIDNFST